MDVRKSVGKLQFNMGDNPIMASPRPRVISDSLARLPDGRVVRVLSFADGTRRILPAQ